MNLIVKEENEFVKLVDKEDHQVFLFSSKANFPAFFAKHYWFVSNKGGELKRWEVSYKKNKYHEFGYIWTYQHSFSKALHKYIWDKRVHWEKSEIKEIINGNKARNLIRVLEKSLEDYPFKEKYSFYPGPNSNTFVQWVIDKFPELNIKLSWDSFGKNYKTSF